MIPRLINIHVRYTGNESSAAAISTVEMGKTDSVVASQGTDPLDALKDAIEFDFSFNSLKSVVLVDCQHSQCQDAVGTNAFVKQLVDLFSNSPIVMKIT